MRWLRHAFALERADAFAPTNAERALAGRLTAELALRGLTLPAVVLLESLRPLGSIAAQAIWFSYPWFAALFEAEGLKVLGQLLERPGGVDWLTGVIADENPQTSHKFPEPIPERHRAPAV